MANTRTVDLSAESSLTDASTLYLNAAGTSKKIAVSTLRGLRNNAMASSFNSTTFHSYHNGRQSSTAVTATASRIYYIPHVVAPNTTLDQLQCRVVNSAAGKVAKMAFYSATASGLPNALLVQSAEFSVNVTNTTITENVTNQTVSGLIYAAFWSDGAPGMEGLHTTSGNVADLGLVGVTDPTDATNTNLLPYETLTYTTNFPSTATVTGYQALTGVEVAIGFVS